MRALASSPRGSIRKYDAWAETDRVLQDRMRMKKAVATPTIAPTAVASTTHFRMLTKRTDSSISFLRNPGIYPS